MGDPIGARELMEESAGIDRRLGNEVGLATMLTNLGHVSLHQGDAERARAELAESVTLCQSLGKAAEAMQAVGLACAHGGRFGGARTHSHAATDADSARGNTLGVAGWLMNLGLVPTHQGGLTCSRALYL
jgi:hypothetical protein